MIVNAMLKYNPVLKSWKLLSKKEKYIVKSTSFIQIFLNLLDLIGIALIATLGALSVQTLGSGGMGNRVGKVISLLNLDSFTFQIQIAFIGVLTSAVFISKTLISAYLVRFTFLFFSRKSTEISAELMTKIVNKKFSKNLENSSQEMLYAATTGVNALMTGILATSINVLSDMTLFVILVSGLFIIDPGVSITIVCIFLLIGIVLYRLINQRAENLGRLSSDLTILNNLKVLEMLQSYKEIIVRGREKFYIDKIVQNRNKLGDVNAELSFQPLISKYVIELASILGILTLAISQFATKDAVYSFAILGTFIAAISRITPSLLRIQQGLLSIKANSGIAENTISLIEGLQQIKANDTKVSNIDFNNSNFIPGIKLKNIFFSYSELSSFKLKAINLEVLPGEIVALVGPSGAGKTTLAELILGLIQPDTGVIEINGVSPEDAIQKWPGSISYVPQNVFISSGTVKENICMGFEAELARTDLIWSCINSAQLSDVVLKLPNGIDTELGENGEKISGGERQRIGIARALYTNPKILVLDESTSSLDSQTEKKFADSIINLRNEVTVIIIAHRLSTLKSVDKIVYIDNGQVLSIGTFDQVRNEVLDFAKQALLMGL
jgi:ABC-type multidrug transport system fused ATPase/permease subunit